MNHFAIKAVQRYLGRPYKVISSISYNSLWTTALSTPVPVVKGHCRANSTPLKNLFICQTSPLHNHPFWTYNTISTMNLWFTHQGKILLIVGRCRYKCSKDSGRRKLVSDLVNYLWRYLYYDPGYNDFTKYIMIFSTIAFVVYSMTLVPLQGYAPS